MSRRGNHQDVTGQVLIASPRAVEEAVSVILRTVDPAVDLTPLSRGFAAFTALYTGRRPGHVGCDTPYHDAQHSLDCALAYARLWAGHEQLVPAHERLGSARGVLGVLVALFHDSGYVRETGDPAPSGAVYTLSHVHRSGDFLLKVLPGIGLAHDAELASRVVHFTGFEMALDSIDVPAHKDRLLGYFLGTADLMAQMADRCYPEKCRDALFDEFSLCGLAGPPRPGGPTPIYDSRLSLISGTESFNAWMRKDRLDGAFEGIHRYYAGYFDGRNCYDETIRANIQRVREALETPDPLKALTRRPRSIMAAELRRIA